MQHNKHVCTEYAHCIHSMPLVCMVFLCKSEASGLSLFSLVKHIEIAQLHAAFNSTNSAKPFAIGSSCSKKVAQETKDPLY